MASYSEKSLKKLRSCDPRLIAVFMKVIEKMDCMILFGFRGEEEQNEAFRNRASKLKWPDSKHNKTPSLAVDVAPYPLDWQDKERFIRFAFYVLGVADAMGIPLRWGGDWDGDMIADDWDLVHFEVMS